MYIRRCQVKITNCTFISNSGSFDGGAIGTSEVTGVISNCIFDSNLNDSRDSRLDAYGGAIGAWRSSISIVNCLIINNISRGIDQYPSTYSGYGGGVYLDNYTQVEPNKMINCTITGNKIEVDGLCGGVFACGDIFLRNCIICNNDLENLVNPLPDIKYCMIYEQFQGEGNIHEPPRFYDRDQGILYLLPDSPCVDSGNAPAAEICFSSEAEEICLNELYSTTHGYPDAGIVNMGFHFNESIPYPTPTPAPCPNTGVTIEMPSHQFFSGDTVLCNIAVCNTSPTTLTGYPLFLILDVHGYLFFAPSFNDFDCYTVDFPSGTTTVSVLDQFTWPENTGIENGILWYSALTTPAVSEIYGTWDSWEFGWDS